MKVGARGTKKEYGYIISEFNCEVEYASVSGDGHAVPIIFNEDEPSNFNLNYLSIEFNEPILEYVYLIVDELLVKYEAVNYHWYRGWMKNDNCASAYYEQYKIYDASKSDTFKICLTMLDDETTLDVDTIKQILEECTIVAER